MRLHGLDIARFLALIGVVFANLLSVSSVSSDMFLYLDGNAAALLVILLGAGFSIDPAVAKPVLKQSIFLFGVGVLLMLIYPAELLHSVALYMLVAYFALRYLPHHLLWVIGGICLLWPLTAVYVDFRTGWSADTVSYTSLWSIGGFLRNTIFNGWHPVIPWAAFFLFGIWLRELPLEKTSTQRRMAIGGFFAVLAARALSGIASNPKLHIADATSLAPIPAGPFFMLHAGAIAVMIIGALLLIAPLLVRLRIAEFVALPGRMILSLYVLHIPFLALTNLIPPNMLIVQFLGTILLFSHLWSRISGRGPLEWVMRRIST